MPQPTWLDAPSPLQYFAALVADDSSFALLEAAVSLAQDEHPALDTQRVLADIDALADTLRRRIPADTVPVQRVRLLNHYFFSELGFAGNVNDYYAVSNSHLHEVLRTRRGIPISLALVYMEIAAQVGLPARGVSFPGHFLVKLRLDHGSERGEVVIDPFTGQSLSREALDERLQPYKQQQGLTGEFDAPLGLFLQAASPREVLGRMLRNLKEIHRSADDAPRLLAVLHRLVVLVPGDWAEQRDRGLVLATLGQVQAAVVDLETYLARCPEAPDAEALRARVADLLRGGGSAARH
ncbi:MAG: hypothetical protein RJA98_1276 [Pseudomonadota bacterium]|jgi:regulator of sirC expression with transglutaminase-like and TPR domain